MSRLADSSPSKGKRRSYWLRLKDDADRYLEGKERAEFLRLTAKIRHLKGKAFLERKDK